MSQPHENLIAWQRSDDLCVAIYEVTERRFPKDERYGLAPQLRRAAYSVAANIVEGYAFPKGRARGRFLRITEDVGGRRATLVDLAGGEIRHGSPV